MNEKEKIKKLTENIHQICDAISPALENPVLKEGLDEEQLRKLKNFVARVYQYYIEFRDNDLSDHPELRKLPWASEFFMAVKRLKKTMRAFDELGMTKEDIFLKRKFWRTVFLTETLIKIYEKIVTGKRKPVTDQERLILDRISNRVRGELESTATDEFGLTYNRWADGIISQNVQVLSNIECVKREVY